MTLFKKITSTFLFIFSFSVFAVEDIPPPPSLNENPKDESKNNATSETPPHETMPTLPEDDSRNIPQPEVRIIRKKDTIIEEYRINGRLRYVKITPKNGVAYYLVDTDGDGILETRENDLDNPPIARWILLEW